MSLELTDTPEQMKEKFFDFLRSFSDETEIQNRDEDGYPCWENCAVGLFFRNVYGLTVGEVNWGSNGSASPYFRTLSNAIDKNVYVGLCGSVYTTYGELKQDLGIV